MGEIRGKLIGDSGWAVPTRARLSFGAGGIRINTDDGQSFEAPWDAVRLRESLLAESDAVLDIQLADGHKMSFEARAAPLLREARARSSTLMAQASIVEGTRAATRRTRWRQLRVVFAIFGVLAALFVAGLQFLPDVVANHFPREWEDQLGLATLHQVTASAKVLKSGPAVDVVHKVWKRLQSGLPPTPYKFQIYVIDSPVVNAFAMPGGYVVVYTGLLRAADSPEALAGILGHEATHVIKKHSLKSMVRSLQWQVGLGLVISMLVGRHEAASVQTLHELASNMDTLAYSRAHESEADHESVKALVRAHIDPIPFTNFFHTLAKKEGSHLAIFSTHPPSENRAQVLQAFAKTLEPYDTRPIDVDWKGMQKALGGKKDINAGDD